MTNTWMVRAGERGWRLDDFEKQSIVAVGWPELGDLTSLRTREEFVRRAAEVYPTDNRFRLAATAGQLFRFVREIRLGDGVVTYDPSERMILVGKILGDYAYKPEASQEQPNIREVHWIGRVPRDAMSVTSRNSLGSISTLFLLPTEVSDEMEARLGPLSPSTVAVRVAPADAADITKIEGEVTDIYKDIQNRALEFIKDRVNRLTWDEMQELVAGLLRAMGYKTRVSPSGADRGKDIIASPDGLGLEEPRIVVEVKHRGVAMGAPEIRGFLGGRHVRDKGLYVSTGGFTKEARYEADRAPIPITLIDFDDLVSLLVEHYEQLDADSKRLVALRKIYWPA